MRVRVLGDFEVVGVDHAMLGSRKARTVLKVLSLAGGSPVTADRLAECVWDDAPPARPAEQVRVLVSRLRGVLGADRLPRTDAGYALVVDWLDLDALAELADEAGRRMAAGSPQLARVAAEAALALVRGPLLPDEADAEWAEAPRARAERWAASARQLAAEAALAGGDLSGAAVLAEAGLDHDPYDEAVLRTLMASLTGSGRPGSALAAYAKVRARLAEDLGVDPAPQTEALHTAILLEQRIPGIGTVPVGARADHPQLATTALLPGRAGSLAALDSALDRAAGGRGGLVVIEGEAGIGKTRLLATWAARAEAAGATVLAARCEELSRGLPLQVVLDAVDDHLLTVGPARAEEVLGWQAALLGPLLGRATTAPATLPLATLRDQVGGQQLLFAALVSVLGRLPAPTVVLVDDAHLAGTATVEWLHYAARRAATLPLLLVAAQRPEEATALRAGSVIRLDPLDEAAAAIVVGEARAADLVARSGGNPLFLVELAAADPTDELPATVRDAVLARCLRAGPEAAATLRTAAMLGADIDLDLLAAVLRTSPVELLDHLEQGLRRGLLRESAGGFEFRHDLVREALAAAATASRRALAHREAGRALAARPRADPLTVAYHARLGGDDELAARALIDAAGVASSRFDQREALRLLDESLVLAESVAGRLLRARVLILVGLYERAADDVNAALGLGGGAPALELGAWTAHYQRDFDMAMRLADEGVREATDDDQRVACLTIGGFVRQCVGDLGLAEDRLEEADRLAAGIWRPVSDVWLGGLRVHQGRCQDGVDLIRPTTDSGRAAAAGQPALHAHPVLHAHLFAALGLANLGRATEALASVAAIDAEEARTGTGRWAGRAENTRGWILRGLGEWAAADEANAKGLERSSAIGMLEPMSHAHLDLAAGALLRGDLDRAAAEVAAAHDLGDRHAMAWRHRLRGQLYRAEIALASGDVAVAHEAAADVREQARRIGTARYRTIAGLLLARTRLAAGEPVDLEEVDHLLSGLSHLAGMEAWRLTGSVAAAASVDRWWVVADTRVAELATYAGDHAATLVRVAGTTLARMRTVSRRG